MSQDTHPWMTRLTEQEHALIEAIRRDPDQEEHIVDVAEDITVRHPVSERLTGRGLWDCPVLAMAMESLREPGRYRLLDLESETFERIDT